MTNAARNSDVSSITDRTINWVEQGLLPDSVVRAGIRRLLRQRLADLRIDNVDHTAELTQQMVALMDAGPIAPVPEKANEQHYEVPAEFFAKALGAHRKYSSCFWGEAKTLDQAEEAALTITCERAQLADGQKILELGCGWGSLTLFMAARYPSAKIIAVSNSASQREYILGEAKHRGLSNLDVITCDMNHFHFDEFSVEKVDRIVSVEMFEHMRNYRALFKRLHGWLKPNGKFFMHIFVHRCVPYEFAEKDSSDWMSRYFFSGGIMPSHDLPLYFQDHLRIEQRWTWDGTHYEKTANAWLANMDANKQSVLALFNKTYGVDQAALWVQRWRIFFMACAELWGYRNGQEWFVSHYLFERR